MGNLSSEVGRTFKAKRQNNVVDYEYALDRALDLFDATVASLLGRASPRVKEVLRAREQFLQALYGDDVSEQDIVSLERYFMQFAVAARLQR